MCEFVDDDCSSTRRTLYESIQRCFIIILIRLASSNLNVIPFFLFSCDVSMGLVNRVTTIGRESTRFPVKRNPRYVFVHWRQLEGQLSRSGNCDMLQTTCNMAGKRSFYFPTSLFSST